MSKKLTLLFTAAVVFFSGIGFASAQMLINEFVADPDSGLEWIELHNDSSATINLDGWSWTELASPGGETEHESSQKSLSGAISAGGFFVFEMSSALNNTGDSIGLYNGGSLIDRVTFGKVSGYPKDLEVSTKGMSGALIGSSWQASQTPTKGQANASSGSSDNNNENSDESNGDDGSDNNNTSSSSGSSTSSSSSSKVSTTTSAKIKTEVTVRDIAYVGIPLAFQGKVMRGGEQLYKGRYFWNFGDGDFREVKVINTDKFTHTYFYPGDYTVVFEYYTDSFAEEPEASEKRIIKVILPQVSISRVGDERDFFVELSNNTTYAAELSGWMLSGDGRSFIIPKNTILGANKKMVISGRTSGFTLSDKNKLLLLTPAQEIAFRYVAYVPHIPIKSPQASTAPRLEARPPSEEADNLSASIASAYAPEENDSTGTFSAFIWPIVFVVFVGLAAAAVYAVRRPKPGAGEDFELLDE